MTTPKRGDQKRIQAKPTKNIEVHYQRSTACRVIHVDGAWGSITPPGLIHMGVYSERVFLPGRVDYPLKSDGTLADVPQSSGILTREFEADLLMTKAVATALRDWLTVRLDEYVTYEQLVEKNQAAKEAAAKEVRST